MSETKKLYFIFPLSGPKNGVNVISNLIYNSLITFFDVSIIDVSQAKDYNNHGKFSFQKILFIFSIYQKLKTLRKNDMVYMNFSLHGFSYYRDLLLLFICSLKCSNITIHFHSNGVEKSNSFFLKFIFKKVKIVTIHNKHFNSIKNYKQKYLLPNALPDFYNTNFSANESSENLIKLLYFSNISVPKGVNLLDDFCSKVLYNKQNVSLTICGGILDETSKEIIKRLVHIYPNITFLGPVENDDVKMNLFHNHDILLFLSDENYEVYPLVYIEALMNGLSIITTKQVISDEIISDNGIVIKDENYLSFLSNCENKHFLNKQKINSRTIFEKNYNYDFFINHLTNILVHEE
jgi:glycosyltransferase involved in cell wall biosynthesis